VSLLSRLDDRLRAILAQRAPVLSPPDPTRRQAAVLLPLFKNTTDYHLEAIRERHDLWAKCSCCCLAVVESRAMTWSQSVEHEMHRAHVNHRRTG
jgi:hypothetical protein